METGPFVAELAVSSLAVSETISRTHCEAVSFWFLADYEF